MLKFDTFSMMAMQLPTSTSELYAIDSGARTRQYSRPRLVHSLEDSNQDIIDNSIRYKTPMKIPPDAWDHIQKKHSDPSRAAREQNSFFLPSLPRKVLDVIVKETCRKPAFYKVNVKKTKGGDKIIYRFQEYDQVIGYHGESRLECFWLVVVAKSNGWVKTAFPVMGPFLPNNRD